MSCMQTGKAVRSWRDPEL